MNGPSPKLPSQPESPADQPGSGATELFPLLYAELRAVAQRALENERAGHTLDATALVNEAYLKLAATGGGVGRSRADFFAIAAQAMRRVLVDHARTRRRLKRGGGARREALPEIAGPDHSHPIDVLALDEALTRLSAEDADAAKVVEMRFFAGMEPRVIALAMGVTERTIRRHWTFAKAWLYRDLERPRSQEDEG
jgi:RNA polymerase sigma-70 factor (ECF subfamily)